MKIEINYNPQERNYTWQVWDGPDGIDHAKGTELTLGGCFYCFYCYCRWSKLK